MAYFMIAILVLIFLVGVSCSFKNEELKLENEIKQKERLGKLEFDKNAAMNCIKYTQLTPDISEMYYNNESTCKFIIRDWRKIRKGKISYFDAQENFLLIESDKYGITINSSANNKFCIHWHITMNSRQLDDIGSKFHLCTMYIGEETIQEFEDEIEREKIEKRVRKAQRKKEIEKEVKRNIKEEY